MKPLHSGLGHVPCRRCAAVSFYNDDHNYISLMQFNGKRPAYRLELEVICEQLCDYLLARDSTRRYNLLYNRKHSLHFGTETYSHLKRHLESGEAYGWEWKTIHPLQALYEHKKLMLMRISYLTTKGFLRSDKLFFRYKEIENLANHLCVMFMKYKSTGQVAILENIMHRLDHMKIKETLVLEEILQELEPSVRHHRSKWPSTRDEMFSKKTIFDSAVLLEKELNGRFEVGFEFQCEAARLDGFIGLASQEALITIQLRLHSTGRIDAADGDAYRAIENMIYQHNDKYRVTFCVDMDSGTYDVRIKSNRQEIFSANGLHFSAESFSAGNIRKVSFISRDIHEFKIATVASRKVVSLK